MSADRVSTQNRIVAQEFRLAERSLSTLLPLGSKVGPLGGLRSRPSDGSPPLGRPPPASSEKDRQQGDTHVL